MTRLLLCLLLPIVSAAPARLLVITAVQQSIPEARQQFEARHGAELLAIEVTDNPSPAAIANAQIIFSYFIRNEVRVRIQPHLDRAAKRGARLLALPGNAPSAEPYWNNGGVNNLAQFFAQMYNLSNPAKPLPVAPPEEAPKSGIYHPKAPGPFSSLKAYLAWYKPARPLVAITFYANNYKFRDLAHIDALIAQLEAQGLAALPVFGYPLAELEQYLRLDGATAPRLILALNLGFAKDDDAARLAAFDVHVINLLYTRETQAEWAKSLKGLPADRLSLNYGAPERAGAAESLLLSTTEGGESKFAQAVPERLQAIAARARRWVTLQDKPNRDKRLAMIYYNNPPGKGNIGASYLASFPSMVEMLKTLQQAGYNTGAELPDEKRLIALLEKHGRNIEAWAPGQLREMMDAGGLSYVPMDTYKRWFAELPKAFRDSVLQTWGPPEKNPIMLATAAGGKQYFVIPGIRLGNVYIGPQPLRSTFDRILDTQHDTLIPVPHSYIAAYLWYRKEFGADAAIHVGRHGTLEWLPGKQTAQSGDDHTSILLGDLPNAYYYIQDGGGEAIQAKRRGDATLISHLNPLITAAGKAEPFRELIKLYDQHASAAETSPEVAAEYKKQIFAEIRKTKLDAFLKLDLTGESWDQIAHKVDEFFHTLENEPLPMGIHAAGIVPAIDKQERAVAEFLRFQLPEASAARHRAKLAEWGREITAGRVPSNPEIQPILNQAAEWLAAVRSSAPAEMAALLRVLNGRHLPSGPLGDPLRVPASVPTGRNLHGFDSSLIPTKAACAAGAKMARDLLTRHQKEEGRIPEKVSLVLWYGETDRHHGAMECMAFHLLGVEPLWNARGVVESFRLIPDAELGRPRVDVLATISGVYRDGYADKVLLLDKAIRLAASAGNNAITRHDAETEAALRANGATAEQARQIARARIFGTQPGHYGVGVERMVERSLDVNNKAGLANVYLHYMNYAFSAETWGGTAKGALAAQLKNNDAILFSRTSTLYGALDNDDTYQYFGGLGLASKTVNGGREAKMFIHNLRRQGSEKMQDLQTFLSYEMNARHWNPEWLREMKKSGYAGARNMFKEMEHLYGFQATAASHVPKEFWQQNYEVYVEDKYGLELDRFFQEANPHAQQWILSRLLEVDRQGTHKFAPEAKARMVAMYVRNVNKNGVACSANTCGNAKLTRHIAGLARGVHGLGKSESAAFEGQMARATGAQASPPPPVPATVSKSDAPPPPVRGFVMEERTMTLANPPADRAPLNLPLGLGLAGIVLLGAVRRSMKE